MNQTRALTDQAAFSGLLLPQERTRFGLRVEGVSYTRDSWRG